MQLNNVTLPFAWLLRQVGKRIRLRGWERVLRFFFHPDKQREYSFALPFKGFSYRAYANNFIDWNALFYGTYEAFELKLLAAHCDRLEGAVFVDVGANVGHHALYMSYHAQEVYAFEPNPALWSLIGEKFSANGIGNIVLHRCGLGNRTDHVPLYLSPESGEGSMLAEANRTSHSSSVDVAVVQGDEYFQQNNINRADVIKMDIEGFEKHAIDGMADHLERWRPLMMIELSETGTEQFGDYSSFVSSFPNDYAFYYCLLSPGLIIQPVLQRANAGTYQKFTGNIFCVPEELNSQFLGLAEIAGYHLVTK